MGKILDRAIAGFCNVYLRFVSATSKIIVEGRTDLADGGDETFVLGIWHGDSFCCYPLLPHRGHVIITTANKRGAVVERISRKFGYTPIRLPDESDPDASLLNLRRMLGSAKDRHLCGTMDGPSGPQHVPSRFFLTAAVLAKKRIMPVSVSVKRKIQSKKRWDKYMIPLPFSRITFTFHEPMEVKKSEFDTLAEKIIIAMNGEL
jgi:hypothetical protein